MIGQCLSNKNENATVSKSKNFLDLNKPLVYNWTIFVKYKRKCYYSYFANFFGSKQGLATAFLFPDSPFISLCFQAPLFAGRIDWRDHVHLCIW